MPDDFTRDSIAREMMQNYIRSRTVAIWQECAGKEPFIGSATCIEIANRLFLSTAAHNFEDIPHDGTVTFFSTSSNTPLAILDQNYSEYGKKGTLDLAWLELDRRSAAENGVESLPLEVVAPYHVQRADGIYQINGFPRELSRPRVINNRPDVTVPLIIYNTSSSKKAKPATDNLLLDYGESGVTNDGLKKMPHPGGISGGGTWYVPSPDELSHVWSPMSHPLVGVVIEYFPYSRLISSLRLHLWLELLLTDQPELSHHIEPLLSQAS